MHIEKSIEQSVANLFFLSTQRLHKVVSQKELIVSEQTFTSLLVAMVGSRSRACECTGKGS